MNMIVDILKEADANFTAEQALRINEKISSMLNYKPAVGVFGKTGVGKSSLCNALFGQDICEVSDIDACTRSTQEMILGLDNGKGITLMDVPGVGENQERDDEYSELYQQLLPKLDLVLWVLKADDRAYSVDIDFYLNVVKPHLQQGKPFIMVLNQVDKVEPFRDWDCASRTPGLTQAKNIYQKVAGVANNFSVKQSAVIPISADEKFGLSKLVDEIVFSLPDEQKVSVAKEVKEENLSNEARQEVKSSLSRVISRTVAGAVCGSEIGGRVAGKAGAVVGAVVGGIGGLLGLW